MRKGEKKSKNWKKFKESAEAAVAEVNIEQAAERDPLSVGLEHLNYVELEEKLTVAEQLAHDNWEKSVRAMAELDNVRRRADKDVANAHRYGLERLISSLLPVVDSLEQALLLSSEKTDASMHEGLELTMRLLLTALEKYDVHQIDPKGESFDPKQHEAMSMQESADVADNSVLMVFQKGYLLSERVIRPARVIVAKNKSGTIESLQD